MCFTWKTDIRTRPFTAMDDLSNQLVSESDGYYAVTARDEPWPLRKHNDEARHWLKCPRAIFVVGILPLLDIL